MGGVVGIANDPLNVNNNSTGSKVPKQYIPVAQAFFIDGYIDSEIPTGNGVPTTVQGGPIIFKNSQRAFKTESSGSSIFMKTSATTKNKKVETATDVRAKIRLGFDSSKGAHRQILVGADPNSSTLFDIGYDALMYDTDTNDMFWEISKSQFVIQAIPDFNVDRIIPVGILVANEGEITIKIDALENIPSSTELYLHDSITAIYHNLRESDFKISLPVGEYNKRFSLRFTAKTLKEETVVEDGIFVLYSSNYKVLIIKNNIIDSTVNEVSLFDMQGRAINNWKIEDKEQTKIEIPIKNLPTGIYITKINTSKGNITKKIIVN